MAELDESIHTVSTIISLMPYFALTLAGLSHMYHMDIFTRDLINQRMSPSAANVIAPTVAVVEFLLGFATMCVLLLSPTSTIAMPLYIAGMSLYALFTLHLTRLIWRRTADSTWIPCACDPYGTPATVWTVLRSGLLTVACAVPIIVTVSPIGNLPLAEASLTILTSGAMTATLWVSGQVLSELQRDNHHKEVRL